MTRLHLPINKQNNKTIITLIGSGASGIALLIQLIERIVENKLQSEVKIVIVDKSRRGIGGVAFNTPYDTNLLNIPAAGMSIVHGDENHFYKWSLYKQNQIRKAFNEITIGEGAHLPRKLYGLYLKESLENVFKIARQVGIEIDFIFDEVVDAIQVGNGYRLHFLKYPSMITDYLTLCIGGFETTPYPEISRSQGYISSPYLSDQLSEIPKSSDVIVIGTRLSAIDTILMLKAHSHTGRIMCVSRHGQLPRVQGAYDRLERPAILTSKILEKLTFSGKKYLKLNQLLGLIRCEAEIQENTLLDCKKIFKFYRNQKGLLGKEIALSINKIRPWQAALFKTNKLVNQAWMNLSPEDQDLVFEKYKGIFLTYRSAMPIQTAIKIHQHLKSRDLFIFRNTSEIRFDSKRQMYSTHIEDKKIEIKAPYVINATGISNNIAHSNNPFIQNLLRKKILIQHRFGGCLVSPHTLNIINGKGEINPSLYAMGSITQGIYLSTSLVEHLVDCSRIIGGALVKDLRHKRESLNKPMVINE